MTNFRFAVMGDGHYGRTVDSPYNDVQRYNMMVNTINMFDTITPFDFCVVNGDIAHENASLLPVAKTYFDQFNMPYYVTHGNHDHADFDDWLSLWGNEMNYDFVHNGWAFIMLNSGTEYGYDEGWGVGYKLPDNTFLSSRVAYYESLNLPIIVFCHIRFDENRFGGNRNGYFAEGLSLHNTVKNSDNVKMVIHSHQHGKSDFENYDDQYYFWTGHFGDRWAEALQYFSFRTVVINEDYSINTYVYNFIDDQIMNTLSSKILSPIELSALTPTLKNKIVVNKNNEQLNAYCIKKIF